MGCPGNYRQEKFKITKRSDWVGKYQGPSVAKAKKLIESCKGSVIFIDEAYSIISARMATTCTAEVLTEIIEAMSNEDKRVIFIMAGYEDDMKPTFHVQCRSRAKIRLCI